MPDFQEFDELFRIIVDSNSPPHQILVTLFNKLLGWKPEKVVQELSGQTMAALLLRLRDDAVRAGMGREYLRSRLRSLTDRLGDSVYAVLSQDANTFKSYKSSLETASGDKTPFANATVGEVHLRQFYGQGDPRDKVYRWCSSIRGSAKKVYVRGHGLRLVSQSSPAHWAISYACVRSLGWEPLRVVTQCSSPALSDLVQRVKGDFVNMTRAPTSIVETWMRPLFARLVQTVAQSAEPSVAWLVQHKAPAGDHHRREKFIRSFVPPKKLSHLLVRDTRLRQYYTMEKDDWPVQITLWSMAAAERALASP